MFARNRSTDKTARQRSAGHFLDEEAEMMVSVQAPGCEFFVSENAGALVLAFVLALSC